MKIVLAGPYPKGTLEKFQNLLSEHTMIPIENQEDYNMDTQAECIIVRTLKTHKECIDIKKDLKAIIRWGTGYDSVDIEAAGKCGILVANTPGVNAYAVSELTVALMLTLLRKIIQQNNNTHGGIWDNKVFASQTITLNNKLVGIIGGGNIGRTVAQQVRTFGAKVQYYDEYRLSKEIEKDYGMEYVEFEELIKTSDVITVHVPITETTKHLIGKKEIQMMKSSAIIINTARGGIVDDAALAVSLKQGKIAGAGLDCIENEGSGKNPFIGMENVIMTPHIGGTVADLADAMVPRIAKQIIKLEKEDTIDYIVNEMYLK